MQNNMPFGENAPVHIVTFIEETVGIGHTLVEGLLRCLDVERVVPLKEISDAENYKAVV